MSATITEIVHTIQEGIKTTDPKEIYIESELESILWKIKSARMKDLDLARYITI
ncbi:MAG: hypothetical protein WBO10_01945 [Pyrinomonadaceae bacterium]